MSPQGDVKLRDEEEGELDRVVSGSLFSFERMSFVNVIVPDPFLLLLGVTDGEEWIWKDQHEINHLCQLHSSGHTSPRSYK